MINEDNLHYFCKKYQINEQSLLDSEIYLEYQSNVEDLLTEFTFGTLFTFTYFAKLWNRRGFLKPRNKVERDIILYSLFTNSNVVWINCGCGVYGKFKKIKKGVK